MKLAGIGACMGLFVASAFAAEQIGSPEFINSLPMETGPYQPAWGSMADQYRVPEWFRDAKLGIFLHWGPCSVPARHGWYGLAMCDQESPEVFDYHRKTYGHQSVFGYKDLIPLWKAEKWNPDALVRKFQTAGARYIMPVAVHHDNFDNYNSTFQPWNSVNMGPKRDIVGDWRKAALKAGIHFTASTHQHESWDWFHRSYNFDKTGDKAGVPWDGWQTKADGKGKWWEGFTPEDLYVHHFLPWDSLDVIHHKMIRTDRGDWPNERDILDDQGKVIGTVKVDPDAQAKFIRNWYLRTKDLIDKYHPEILYFDWGCPFSHLPCKDACYLRLQAHYYNASLKSNHDQMLVGANLKHIKHWPVEWLTGSHDQVRRSCVEDFEGGRAGDVPAEYPWQQCNAINNEWFDDINNPQRATKRPEDIVRMLVDTTARNGNLLLNISLHADGTVVAEDQAALDALTAFMSVNSEAIHGTRPWIVAMDRPSDTYFTTKDNALYVIGLRWPDNNKLVIRTLADDRSPWVASVEKAGILGSSESVKFTRTAQGMTFDLADTKRANFALKLTGKGTPVVARASAPVAIVPPDEQDKMEQAIRKHLGSLAGRPNEGKMADELRNKVADILRDGLCCFSGFIVVIEAIETNPNGPVTVRLKSFVNAEATYVFKVAPDELAGRGTPLKTGDKVVLDGRYEGASIKTSTVDFPEIHGYVTRLFRVP